MLKNAFEWRKPTPKINVLVIKWIGGSFQKPKGQKVEVNTSFCVKCIG
jgi:hypothetical protein